MIGADDRVSAVLKRDESLIDVFVGVSPSFEMLRKPAMRRTMARMVTVSQAARIAGVDVSILLERLNAAFSGQRNGLSSEEASGAPAAPNELCTAPAGLLERAAEHLVDLDVREDLREGREPFARIMATVRSLGPQQVLRLRATFEPAPLYGVLAKQGFSYFTEELEPEDWRVWFFRPTLASAPTTVTSVANTGGREGTSASEAGSSPELEAGRDLVILDVRDLEPPEPMVQTLEALAALKRGQTLLQINQRVPQFLLPKIVERGFTYEIREQSAEIVRIFIRHKG